MGFSIFVLFYFIPIKKTNPFFLLGLKGLELKFQWRGIWGVKSPWRVSFVWNMTW